MTGTALGRKAPSLPAVASWTWGRLRATDPRQEGRGSGAAAPVSSQHTDRIWAMQNFEHWFNFDAVFPKEVFWIFMAFTVLEKSALF